MIRKAAVRDLMKKLHKKQEEIIPSIEPPFCGHGVRIREVTLYCY